MTAVSDELERIRHEKGGTLRAEDVVEAAKDESNPLHPKFCWDDTEAAQRYRLWQARDIIRIEVTVLVQTNEPIRVYASLLEDRKNNEGYRHIIDILSNSDMRKRLLAQALRELQTYEEKYRVLTELAPLFKTAQKIRKKHNLSS